MRDFLTNQYVLLTLTFGAFFGFAFASVSLSFCFSLVMTSSKCASSAD